MTRPDLSWLALIKFKNYARLTITNCHMSRINKTSKLKKFINNFNYPEPHWEKLPEGFPYCDTRGLNPHEEGLFSGIVLIWYANHGGRPILLKSFSQSLVLILAMVISGMMVKNILTSDMFERTLSVNAATISGTLRTLNVANDNNSHSVSPSYVLESTVSGLLKKSAN